MLFPFSISLLSYIFSLMVLILNSSKMPWLSILSGPVHLFTFIRGLHCWLYFVLSFVVITHVTLLYNKIVVAAIVLQNLSFAFVRNLFSTYLSNISNIYLCIWTKFTVDRQRNLSLSTSNLDGDRPFKCYSLAINLSLCRKR